MFSSLRESVYRRFISIAISLFTVICSAPAAFADSFDWRDINGLDYTTPVRNQGSAGTCWAFATIAAAESRIEISLDRPNLNPDLSEQHLVSDGYAGTTAGGWEYRAMYFIGSVGVVTEAELPYQASDFSPDWPLDDGWEDRVYKIVGYDVGLNNQLDNLKSKLEQYGPLIARFDAGNDWYWPDEPLLVPEPADVIDHNAAIIGYQDDLMAPGGGYWILKNSWGTGWGDDGYGYLPYETLSDSYRIHVFTGWIVEPIPEPASLALMGIGMVTIAIRRRR